MSFENNFKILNQIGKKEELDNEDFKILIELSNNNDAEIRAYVAEILGIFNNIELKNILFNLCDDSDELVRVNACDSLSVYKDLDVIDKLKNCILKDNSVLVKTYSVLSIIDIVSNSTINVSKKELISLFIKLSKEKNTSIKAACYKGLYLFYEKQYLCRFWDLLSSETYQDRLFVLNSIIDIINNDNKSYIKMVLINQLSVENSEAVKIKINEILKL